MSNPWRAHRRQPEEFLGRLLLSEADHDEIDELAADPMLDCPPAIRSKTDADRLLSLLDELEGREAE